MINIAICDDDVEMTTSIEELLLKISAEQNIKINCSVFFDGMNLVKNIQQGDYYDLIYLDIEMKLLDGINAAKMIREIDIPALIIYVSSYEKYLKELFDTEPFRFISKPISEHDFQTVFFDAYRRIQKKSGYFSYTYNKEFLKLPLDKICYFESSNRVIYIHVSNHGCTSDDLQDATEYRFYGKMNDVEKELININAHFIRIHQSYLVNFDYIKSMNFTSITLSDGTMLQVSEDKQKHVRRQFFSMIRSEAPGNNGI